MNLLPHSRLIRSIQPVLLSLALLATTLVVLHRFALPARAGTLDVCATCTYATIQTALDHAGSNDTINVAAGTYAEHIVINKSVTLIGGWLGAPPFTSRTPGASIIDGSNTDRVVYISGSISPVIDGFTIRHGNASHSTAARGRGSGIYVITASLTLQNNQIVDNSSNDAEAFGGGIAVYSGSVVISNNVIARNVVTANTPDVGGAGLFVFDTSSLIVSNTFDSNRSFGHGGGAFIYNPQSHPATVQHNLFLNNHALGVRNGGGLLAEGIGGGFMVIDSNRFFSNTSDNSVLGVDSIGDFQVTNNLLKYNANGGIWVYATNLGVVAHNVILQNSGIYGGIRLGQVGSVPYVYNNIVMSNGTGLEVVSDVLGLWDYNLVRGNTDYDYIRGTPLAGTPLAPGPHDLNADPKFVNPAAGDYHLQLTSPAINRGGAFNLPGSPGFDYDGHPRPFTAYSNSCDPPDIGMFERTEPQFLAPCYFTYLPVIAKNH